MEIIEYQNLYQEKVKDLLVELQEFVTSIDQDKLNIITPEYREEYFVQTLSEVASKNGKMFLAKEGNNIIGMIACFQREYDDMDKLDYKCPKMGIVQELIISKNYRGGGVGDKLLTHAENYLKDNGCEYVMLDVFAYNEKGYNFYKKHGYNNRMITMLKKFD